MNSVRGASVPPLHYRGALLSGFQFELQVNPLAEFSVGLWVKRNRWSVLKDYLVLFLPCKNQKEDAQILRTPLKQSNSHFQFQTYLPPSPAESSCLSNIQASCTFLQVRVPRYSGTGNLMCSSWIAWFAEFHRQDEEFLRYIDMWKQGNIFVWFFVLQNLIFFQYFFHAFRLFLEKRQF